MYVSPFWDCCWEESAQIVNIFPDPRVMEPHDMFSLMACKQSEMLPQAKVVKKHSFPSILTESKDSNGQRNHRWKEFGSLSL